MRVASLAVSLFTGLLACSINSPMGNLQVASSFDYRLLGPSETDAHVYSDRPFAFADDGIPIRLRPSYRLQTANSDKGSDAPFFIAMTAHDCVDVVVARDQ